MLECLTLGSSILFFEKKDVTFQMCTNSRMLNEVNDQEKVYLAMDS
jgi:hypothetical protein